MDESPRDSDSLTFPIGQPFGFMFKEWADAEQSGQLVQFVLTSRAETKPIRYKDIFPVAQKRIKIPSLVNEAEKFFAYGRKFVICPALPKRGDP